MIDRTTLQFSLVWKLMLLLVVVSIALIAGLRWYVCQVSAGYQSDLAHAVLLEFFTEVVWAIPVVGISTLAMGIWAIRSGLAPLRMLSTQLSQMAPGSRLMHLSGRMLPGEIVPLVAAVDDAFGRLHAAYEATAAICSERSPRTSNPACNSAIRAGTDAQK